MRKYRQTVRVSLLGLTMVMLMSAGVLFFNTHASEAVSGSDIQVSDSDTNQNELSKIVVNRADSAEPRPTLARTPNIVKNPALHTAPKTNVNQANCALYFNDLGFSKTKLMIFSTFSKWSDGGLITNAYRFR